MRVVLCSNHRSGRGLAAPELEDLIRHAGHTLVQSVDVQATTVSAIDPAAEVAVAAGGDGTVASMARRLAGTGLPLAILPLGTANNIARSLGIEGSVTDLVHGWHRARGKPVDVGTILSAQGEKLFLEGVGGGLIPAVIDSMRSESAATQAVAIRLAKANNRYRELLPGLKASHWTVIADDERIEGRMVLVEVLNTDWLGPNLKLSREVSPFDGLLSVVVVREEQREELSAFLHAHDAGATVAFTWPVVHARTVKLLPSADVHVDDTVHSRDAFGHMEMQTRPGALVVLT